MQSQTYSLASQSVEGVEEVAVLLENFIHHHKES